MNGFSSGLEGLSVLLLSLLFDAMMMVCLLGEGCGGVVIDWRDIWNCSWNLSDIEGLKHVRARRSAKKHRTPKQHDPHLIPKQAPNNITPNPFSSCHAIPSPCENCPMVIDKI